MAPALFGIERHELDETKLKIVLARKPEQVDAANPRPNDENGHIIEIAPADGDHRAASSIARTS